MSSVLKVDNIEKYYGSKANLTKAIDRISFEVENGYYQTERKASFKIQERGTGIYLSGL